MSDILYKSYMGKTVTCHTLTMSTVIVVLYLCMLTMVCVHVYVQQYLRTQDSPQHMWTKNIVLYGQTQFQCRAFIACSISTRPRYSLWLLCYIAIYIYVLNYLAGPAHNCMQHMLHSASYYFHLKLWTEQLQLQLASYLLQLRTYRLEFELMLEPFITSTFASYNFNISSCNCSESVAA